MRGNKQRKRAGDRKKPDPDEGVQLPAKVYDQGMRREDQQPATNHQNSETSDLRRQTRQAKLMSICSAVLTIAIGVTQVFYTREQVADAKLALRLDQRAWLVTRDISGHQMQVGKLYAPSVQIRNQGRTPARNVRVRYRTWAGPDSVTPPIPDSADDYVPINEPDGRSVLYPEQDIWLGGIGVVPCCGNVEGSTAPATAEMVEAMLSGDHTVYLFGRVSYEDVFGHERFTEYCFRSIKGGQYRQCDEHNEFE